MHVGRAPSRGRTAAPPRRWCTCSAWRDHEASARWRREHPDWLRKPYDWPRTSSDWSREPPDGPRAPPDGPREPYDWPRTFPPIPRIAQHLRASASVSESRTQVRGVPTLLLIRFCLYAVELVQTFYNVPTSPVRGEERRARKYRNAHRISYNKTNKTTRSRRCLLCSRAALCQHRHLQKH